MVELFRLWKLDCASGQFSVGSCSDAEKIRYPDRRFLRRSHSTTQRTACVVFFALDVSKCLKIKRRLHY